MTRIEGTRLPGSPIDWNGDGLITPILTFAQDAGFSGAPVSLNASKKDWDIIDLRQTGSRRAQHGYSLNVGLTEDLGSSGDLGPSGDLGGELDFETAIAIPPAPNSLAAAVVNEHIDLNFNVPNAGNPDQFQVWRAECPSGTALATPCALSPSNPPVRIGTFSPGVPCATAHSSSATPLPRRMWSICTS